MSSQSFNHIGAPMGAPNVFNFKLVLLGDASVGKSCAVVRFAKNEFHENQEPTIGAAFMTQSVEFDDYTVKYEIWDTAGQERFRSLAPMYYRGASAAVIVYDLTSRESFEAAKSWISELQLYRNADLVLALVGNKLDMGAERQVETSLGRSYAEANNAIFMETSAKTGTNIRELFEEIAKRLPKHRQEQDDGAFHVESKNRTPSAWCPGCDG